MAKKPSAPKLSSSQVVAVSLLRKAMSETGCSRDKLPTAAFKKLTTEFNKSTGGSLSVDEYRDLAVSVDKKGTPKINQALASYGLELQPKR